MKTIKRKTKGIIGMIILLMTILFTGCNKMYDKPDNPREYEVAFSINAMSIEKPSIGAKSSMSMESFMEAMMVDPEEVTHVRIGIDGTHDNPFISQTLEYSISDGVTEPIKLAVGNHNLTSMVLLKESEPDVFEVLYSAVADGAELSQFVSTTLPLSFQIPLLNQTSIAVDVVALDDWTPEEFGWALFSMGFTTVQPLYFYGAQNDNSQSVMSMEIYNGSSLISSSIQEPEGWIKILYPDVYSISNNVESYTFKLLKDGIEYSRTFTVGELLALPREVHLLNVYGSGMMGFVQAPVSMVFNIKLNHLLIPDGKGKLNPSAFTVKNSMNEIVYQSPALTFIDPFNTPSGGSLFFNYLDRQDVEDNDEMYTITMSYYNYTTQWTTTLLTKTATVSVATLKSAGDIVLQEYSSNMFWWEFI